MALSKTSLATLVYVEQRTHTVSPRSEFFDVESGVIYAQLCSRNENTRMVFRLKGNISVCAIKSVRISMPHLCVCVGASSNHPCAPLGMCTYYRQKVFRPCAHVDAASDHFCGLLGTNILRRKTAFLPYAFEGARSALISRWPDSRTDCKQKASLPSAPCHTIEMSRFDKRQRLDEVQA